MDPSSDPELLWSPSDPTSTQTYRFLSHINSAYSLALKTYADLYNWSISNRGEFWSSVWDFTGVIGEKGKGPYVDKKATPGDCPKWFEGASLNWAENQLNGGEGRDDEVAVVQGQESCPSKGFEPARREVKWGELREMVGRVQRGMKALGVEKGDTVAFWGGNCLVRSFLSLSHFVNIADVIGSGSSSFSYIIARSYILFGRSRLWCRWRP